MDAFCSLARNPPSPARAASGEVASTPTTRTDESTETSRTTASTLSDALVRSPTLAGATASATTAGGGNGSSAFAASAVAGATGSGGTSQTSSTTSGARSTIANALLPTEESGVGTARGGGDAAIAIGLDTARAAVESARPPVGSGSEGLPAAAGGATTDTSSDRTKSPNSIGSGDSGSSSSGGAVAVAAAAAAAAGAAGHPAGGATTAPHSPPLPVLTAIDEDEDSDTAPAATEDATSRDASSTIVINRDKLSAMLEWARERDLDVLVVMSRTRDRRELAAFFVSAPAAAGAGGEAAPVRTARGLLQPQYTALMATLSGNPLMELVSLHATIGEGASLAPAGGGGGGSWAQRTLFHVWHQRNIAWSRKQVAPALLDAAAAVLGRAAE
jgi:hypothetical protein